MYIIKFLTADTTSTITAFQSMYYKLITSTEIRLGHVPIKYNLASDTLQVDDVIIDGTFLLFGVRLREQSKLFLCSPMRMGSRLLLFQ